MENHNEQEIDQLLDQEIQKLKKAIEYIEEAKKTDNSSKNLLAEMNTKYDQILKSESDIETKIQSISQSQHNEIIASSDRLFNQKIETELLKFKKSIELIDKENQEKIFVLTNKNKSLKTFCYVSFVCAIIAIIIGIIF